MAPLHDQLAALEHALPDLTTSELAEAIQRLAAAQVAVAARLAASARSTGFAGRGTKCLNIEEAASLTRLGKSTIRAKIAAGDLVEGVHFTRKRRRLILFQEALEDWLKAPAARVDNPCGEEVVPIVPRRRRNG